MFSARGGAAAEASGQDAKDTGNGSHDEGILWQLLHSRDA
jgi:hypothetical protein